MNPQKTIINGQEYEIVSAEVVDVDFSGTNKEKLYTIKCKLIGSFGSQASVSTIQARALDANIKNIPIAGEVVILLKAPSPYDSYLGTGQEYYYTNPVSIQSSVHHNGIPGLTDVLENKNSNNKEKVQRSQVGITEKTSKNKENQKTIDPRFGERLDVRPVQPYSGDIILEGRWGQSIRFGSSIDEQRNYPVSPYWKPGLGDIGNPILIISNGTTPDKKTKDNEFISENPDTDDASIWMTSGQSVKFTPASSYTPSILDKQVDLFNKNKFGGNQVIIASDRLIFNARKQELIAFSKEGIGFSSEKAISIDGKQVVETESKRINLGINAKSPILLGDRTMDWLNELCNILSSFLTATGQLTVPTGVGPSGIPINVSSFVDLKGKVKGIQQKIEKLQSQLAFVNEFSKGPTEEAKSKEEEREQRQEMRNAGEEPPRPASDPNETALSPRDTQTLNQWQGNTLWDPNRNKIYGTREKDSMTWFYDKEWEKYVNNMGDSDIIDPITGEKINGLNVDPDFTKGSTTFNSDFMDSVAQGDTGAIEDNQQYPDPSDVPGEEKPTD
jgi:hypothetical protein